MNLKDYLGKEIYFLQSCNIDKGILESFHYTLNRDKEVIDFEASISSNGSYLELYEDKGVFITLEDAKIYAIKELEKQIKQFKSISAI